MHAGVASGVVALTRSKLTKRLLTAPLQFDESGHIVDVAASSGILNAGVFRLTASGCLSHEKLWLTEQATVGFDEHFWNASLVIGDVSLIL